MCVIAAGLTFLETIANPYTTVLGDQQLRRHPHQPRPVLQRHRLDLRPDRRRHVLLRQGCRRREHRRQTLWIPYAGVAVVVIVLAVIFYFANVPDIKTEDDYHLDDAPPGVSHSIWTHPHFVMAVAAQFFYVAAQAGIFSFFINYMTSQVPAIPGDRGTRGFLKRWFETGDGRRAALQRPGGGQPGVARLRLLPGRPLHRRADCSKKFAAHKVLGLYGLLNVVVCLLVFLKLGWLSVVCVFLSYFFMSIMFPTIFALGIFGLGARAKKASAFIVMAIMGGAILPKLMGYVGDQYDMSRGFIVPLVCFAFVAFYGFNWSRFSRVDSLGTAPSLGRH